MTHDPVRVLHVDPDPEWTDRVAAALDRSGGVEVVTVTDATAGLDRIAADGVDCVVVAHDPPGMDGIGFVERATARDGVPPVLLFAEGDGDDADAALDAGAAGYLSRGSPGALARLAARVRHAVSEYRIATTRPAYEAVVGGLDVPIYVLDATGRFTLVNDAFLDLTGYDRASLLGSHASLLETPAMATRAGEPLAATRAGAGPGDGRHEVQITTADGRTLLCEDRLGVLPLAGERRHGFAGVLRDVTDRARRERVLAALHETTRELMAADSETEIFDRVLEAAATVLGLDHVGIHRHDPEREALVPVAWHEGIAETIGDPPTLGTDSLAWTAFRTGETRRYDDLREAEGTANPETPLRSELIVPLADRGVAIFASTDPGAFTREDERLAEVLCANATAALDRTEREAVLRRRERQLERENERLERLTGFLSHDLRNPLQVAKGRLELAREARGASAPDRRAGSEAPPAESDEYLAKVSGALDRMETLVADLLTMAREGRTVDRTEPVDLADLARESWRNVETGGADLRVETDATVRADPDRLARVFENLFRNSVEHGSTDSRAEPGDSVEHSSTGSRADPGDSVEHGAPDVTVTVGDVADGFYVADDGPGIPDDERERVFSAGYSTASDGTGFGLAIVAEVVEAHGWSIAATEGRDGGARFEITGLGTA